MLERQVTCLVPGVNMETYHGHVRTPADAIILFEACRIGLLPRVQRRLSEKERQTIQSGSIFVWDEREAGMRRWTDGKSWSASRVSGSFLTYREMEGKRGGNGMAGPVLAYANPARSNDPNDEGPDGYRYKPDGLMKQSFSITTSTGQHLHLISYYSRTASAFHNLTQPSQDPHLRNIRPEKGMYPESTVHDHNSIPAVTRTPMAGAAYPHNPPAQGAPMHSPAYGRGPAPPYHGYAAPGWAPPSPLHTPPPYYQQNAYDHHGYHLSPHQPTSHAPYQAYHSGAVPTQTPFDRAPPPLAHSSLPPPPPPSARYPPMPPSGPSLPPVSSQAVNKTERPTGTQQPTPGSSITSDSGFRQDSVHPRAGERATMRNSTTPPSGALQAMSGTTIPSISSLISGGHAASEEHARRAASSSPGVNGNIPPVRPLQDIPLHKLAFAPASDARALRDLDKATFRA